MDTSTEQTLAKISTEITQRVGNTGSTLLTLHAQLTSSSVPALAPTEPDGFKEGFVRTLSTELQLRQSVATVAAPPAVISGKERQFAQLIFQLNLFSDKAFREGMSETCFSGDEQGFTDFMATTAMTTYQELANEEHTITEVTEKDLMVLTTLVRLELWRLAEHKSDPTDLIEAIRVDHVFTYAGLGVEPPFFLEERLTDEEQGILAGDVTRVHEEVEAACPRRGRGSRGVNTIIVLNGWIKDRRTCELDIPEEVLKEAATAAQQEPKTYAVYATHTSTRRRKALRVALEMVPEFVDLSIEIGELPDGDETPTFKERKLPLIDGDEEFTICLVPGTPHQIAAQLRAYLQLESGIQAERTAIERKLAAAYKLGIAPRETAKRGAELKLQLAEIGSLEHVEKILGELADDPCLASLNGYSLTLHASECNVRPVERAISITESNYYIKEDLAGLVQLLPTARKLVEQQNLNLVKVEASDENALAMLQTLAAVEKRIGAAKFEGLAITVDQSVTDKTHTSVQDGTMTLVVLVNAARRVEEAEKLVESLLESHRAATELRDRFGIIAAQAGVGESRDCKGLTAAESKALCEAFEGYDQVADASGLVIEFLRRDQYHIDTWDGHHASDLRIWLSSAERALRENPAATLADTRTAPIFVKERENQRLEYAPPVEQIAQFVNKFAALKLEMERSSE